MGTSELVQLPASLPENVSHHVYSSVALNMDVGYCVLLPPDFDPDYAGYPVLYWLHGRGGSELSGLHLAEILFAEMGSQNMPPMIVVFPNGGPQSMYCDAAGDGLQIETWIMSELVPHIDETYPTIPNGSGRAVEGYSMGGFGAMHLALKYPKHFSVAVSHAGALHTTQTLSTQRKPIFEGVFGGSKERFEQDSPFCLASLAAGNWTHGTGLYLTVGTEDPTWEYNLLFANHLQALGIPFAFRSFEGFGHNDTDHYEALSGGGLYPYCVAFGAGCRQKRVFEDDLRHVHKNLEFARWNQRRMLLDLYLPKGVERPPLIVWIYGGAFRTGSKETCRAQFLASHGFAVASIEYRLSGEAVFPAQIIDCKAAIRWLKKHADEYGYDASRIGVWGASAGGHLAALVGTTGDYRVFDTGPNMDVTSDVQAVCDYFGPVDFSIMNAGGSDMDHDSPYSPESLLVGGPITKYPDLVARANPASYITGNEPPFLIAHGDADRLVPVNSSELLHRELTDAGVASILEIVSGGDHGLTDLKFDEKVAQFFSKLFEVEHR